MAARHPAAFINNIAEEGTKEEAIKLLQDTWDDLCDLKQAVLILQREGGDIATIIKSIRYPNIKRKINEQEETSG